MKSLSNLERYDEKPIIKSIFLISLPVILGNLASVIYNLTDSYFVGKLSVAQLAGATFSYPFLMIVTTIGAIFSIGSASFISRKLGEQRNDLAEIGLNKGIFACFIFALFIVASCFIFIDPIIKILGAEGEAFVYTKQYIMILIIGVPFIMLNQVFADVLRSEGAAKWAMFTMFIGVLINVALDPLFIFVFNLQIRGAALATILSNMLASIFAFTIYHKVTSLKIKFKKAFVKDKILKEIVFVGLPGALNLILMNIGIIITNNVASKYGDAVVSGMGLSLRIVAILIQILLGFSLGVQPLIGYNYGKKNFRRMLDFIKNNIFIITIISSFFSILIFIFAPDIIKIFKNEPEVVSFGSKALRALILMKPVIGVFIVTINSIQALGKAKIALIFSISRQLILFVTALLLLNYFFGKNGFIFAQAISDFIMIIVAGLLLLHMFKKYHYSTKSSKQESK